MNAINGSQCYRGGAARRWIPLATAVNPEAWSSARAVVLPKSTPTEISIRKHGAIGTVVCLGVKEIVFRGRTTTLRDSCVGGWLTLNSWWHSWLLRSLPSADKGCGSYRLVFSDMFGSIRYVPPHSDSLGAEAWSRSGTHFHESEHRP